MLCDLDNVPIYVGQSDNNIRDRVQRHLTGGRSDTKGNFAIDVWEVAFVRYWTTATSAQALQLEADVYHHFHSSSPLMNHKQPTLTPTTGFTPSQHTSIQLIEDAELASRKETGKRLARQAFHLSILVDYATTVKKSKGLKLSMKNHLDRLMRLYGRYF